MADETQNDVYTPEVETNEPPAGATPGIAPPVAAQESKLVGDEAIASAAAEDDNFVADHTDEEADAQVVQDREKDPATVAVKETHVKVDTVITDPSSPLAVQVPDAGRGDASTPIANAFLDAKTVEEQFDAAQS